MELSELPHQIRKTVASLMKEGKLHKWSKERVQQEAESRARYNSWSTRTELAVKLYIEEMY